MAPTVTLYILGGCVAASIGLFIVMLIVSATRTAPSGAALARPSYPALRRHEWGPVKVVRYVAVLIVVCLIVATATIAYPPLFDPLCDHQWFGSDAAARLREHARDAHAAIAAQFP